MSRIALVIGTNYSGTPYALQGCVNDANDWAEVLSGRGFDVAQLLDGAATRAGITAALGDDAHRLGRGDLLFVTFSGHGTWVPDRDNDEADHRDEAICPHDIGQAGPIVDDELHSIFASRSWGSHVVMISDSCFSGTMQRFMPPLTPDKPEHHVVRFLPPEHWAAASDVDMFLAASGTPARGRPRSGALVLSGCKDTEYSYDAFFGGRPNGAFTRVAIDALARVENDANYRDWHRAIRSRLPSVDYPQSPQLDGTASQKRQTIFT